jgi:mono/diheme cytochrome c family protein
MKKKKLLAAMGFIVALVCAQFLTAQAAAQRGSGTADFVRDIQPILQQYCYQCHGPTQQSAGLRLDLRDSALAKVILPGKATESALYRRIAGLTDQARMPLGGQLDSRQIALIKTWIDQGAEWPGGAGAKTGEAVQHWAFIPPVRPPLPEIKRRDWARNPIDYFTLARLEREKLSPSPEADRATLLRRLSLDLRGLPPHH